MNRKNGLIFIIVALVILVAVACVFISLYQGQTKSYCVTFQDHTGTVLKTETVMSGSAAVAPTAPEREGYEFAGWSMDFSAVTRDMTVIAEYIQQTETTFTVDTVTVTPDVKKTEVKISVAQNPGILGMMLSIDYDEDNLKLLSCQNGVALSALTFQEPSRLKSGCHFIWYGSETGEVMDGEMLILTFEIADEAAPGTYPITISWNLRDIYDSNTDMLDPYAVQGAIVISE